MVNFPIADEIWSSFLILAIILTVPAVMGRIRFPRIAGLIIIGMLVGPGCLGLLTPNNVLSYFSRIGLLLIMFFAGLSIDIEEMKQTKGWGILFGLLTFIVPFTLCVAIGYTILGYDLTASAIIGCVLGSHTLISYPIISRHGLGRRKSVAISVTGALVAIVFALVLYSFIISAAKGVGSFNIWIFLIEFAIYLGVIIVGFSQIAKLFFRRSGNSNSHFLFVLMMLALSCGLAGLIGLEGILGAFLAGIVLNRYIPQSSPLMNRLDFTGNTLFIPLFLLDTGMMIRPAELAGNTGALVSFLILFSVATLAKWLPALTVQKGCRMTRGDRMIIFGLSESHAAGALAIVMGAASTGIVSNEILGTIVMIVLFSCILSNIITERGSAIILSSDRPEDNLSSEESILVCMSGAKMMRSLMDASMAIRRKGSKDELVGLHITIGGEHVRKYMSGGKDTLLEAKSIAVAAEVPFQMQNRVGTNITGSIVHAAEEFESTQIVMGLTSVANLNARYYENIIRPLADNCGIQQTFMRISVPLNTIHRIVVLVSGPVIQDKGLEKCVGTIGRLGLAIGCESVFYGKESAIDAVRSASRGTQSGKLSFFPTGESADMNSIILNANNDDLIILIGHRNTETHAGRAFMHLYEHLRLRQEDCNLMIIYPESPEQNRPQSLSSVRTDRDLLKMLRI